MTDRHAINRPDCERAHSVSAALCDDPGCGLHLIAWRHDDKAICEIVMGRPAIRELLAMIHEHGLDL
jgi:hypothetical protein